jgi:hypothetical protein
MAVCPDITSRASSPAGLSIRHSKAQRKSSTIRLPIERLIMGVGVVFLSVGVLVQSRSRPSGLLGRARSLNPDTHLSTANSL